MAPHAATPLHPATASPSDVVPALEPGDHLSRDEFERRFDSTSGLKKAELVEGMVHMPPPVRWGSHATPHADLIGWLVFYRAATPGVVVGDNGSLRLDLDNMPQPDAAMIIDPAFGGQSVLGKDDYIEGAPELVAEISASSVSIDMNAKLHAYRRNGVREYLVWRVNDEAIDWFTLRQGTFEKLTPTPAGDLCSELFPGLWLNVPSMVGRHIAAVFKTLQQGIDSPEHAALVKLLQSRGAGISPP